MRLGLYIIASIILMALVGAFIYTGNPTEYNINELGFPIDFSMPVAAWIVVPMFILMLASLVHMMFYSTKNFFKFKKWDKDSESLEDSLYWALLNEPKYHKFNLPKLKETASLLSVSKINIIGKVDTVSEKLTDVLGIVSDINSGEYVDLRAKKLQNVLSKENPLVLKNLLNKLKIDEAFAEEVVEHQNDYSTEIYKEAMYQFTSVTTFGKARKYVDLFSPEDFIRLFNRVSKEDNLGFDKDVLDEFIVAMEPQLECSDYLKIATRMMQELSPDDNLKLWREYETKYPKAQIAYLYLLFDYELIDKAGEYLAEHDEDDFKRFRALYDLKREHKKYKITDLMNIRHICDA